MKGGESHEGYERLEVRGEGKSNVVFNTHREGTRGSTWEDGIGVRLLDLWKMVLAQLPSNLETLLRAESAE